MIIFVSQKNFPKTNKTFLVYFLLKNIFSKFASINIEVMFKAETFLQTINVVCISQKTIIRISPYPVELVKLLCLADDI